MAVTKALHALAAGDAVLAAQAFLEAAELEEREWRMDSAEAWALAAHRAVEGERDRRHVALALRRAARAARGRGRLADAATRYHEAYRISSAAADDVGAAVAAIGGGNVEVDRGGWGKAERWYRAALEHVGRTSYTGPERWHACVNLSIVARRRGDLTASAEWLEAAEESARALGYPARVVELENEWGMFFLARGEPRMAEGRFREALHAMVDPESPSPAVSRPGARVTVLVNLGRALLEQGRALEASETAREAEADAVRAGVATKLPEVYRLLGAVGTAWGRPDAFVFYERALELIEREGLPPWERAQTLDEYALLLDAEGRAEEAGAFRREADALRSSSSGVSERPDGSEGEERA
jgi:tetratricopeptide (TPR) repeat protein